MAVQQSQDPVQKLFEYDEVAPWAASGRKALLMARFKRLAPLVESIDARLLELSDHHDDLLRGLPTREESNIKPEPQRKADARLRNRAKKERWVVQDEIRKVKDRRDALMPAIMALMDELSELGVSVQSPWLVQDDFLSMLPLPRR